MNTCSNCRYYTPKEPLDDEDFSKGSKGECHRYPRRVVAAENTKYSCLPEVSSHDFCGEHFPKLRK